MPMNRQSMLTMLASITLAAGCAKSPVASSGGLSDADRAKLDEAHALATEAKETADDAQSSADDAAADATTAQGTATTAQGAADAAAGQATGNAGDIDALEGRVGALEGAGPGTVYDQTVQIDDRGAAGFSAAASVGGSPVDNVERGFAYVNNVLADHYNRMQSGQVVLNGATTTIDGTQTLADYVTNIATNVSTGGSVDLSFSDPAQVDPRLDEADAYYEYSAATTIVQAIKALRFSNQIKYTAKADNTRLGSLSRGYVQEAIDKLDDDLYGLINGTVAQTLDPALVQVSNGTDTWTLAQYVAAYGGGAASGITLDTTSLPATGYDNVQQAVEALYTSLQAFAFGTDVGGNTYVNVRLGEQTYFGDQLLSQYIAQVVTDQVNDITGGSFTAAAVDLDESAFNGNAAQYGNVQVGLESLYASVAANAAAIATNAGNITANAGNITTLQGDVTTNAGNITTNAANITANAGDITNLEADVATNAGNIQTNGGALQTLTATVTGLAADVDTLEANNNGLVRIVGVTAPVAGNFGDGDARCAAAHAGSHWCALPEIRQGQINTQTDFAVIRGVSAWVEPLGNGDNCQNWTYNSGHIATGTRFVLNNANDPTQGAVSVGQNCGAAAPLMCCQ